MSQVDPRWKNEVLGHADWLRSIVGARIGNKAYVDDIVQDVFSDAMAIENPQIVENSGPWLYRIAIRKVLLLRRKMGRQRKAMDRVRNGYAKRQEDEKSLPIDMLLISEQNKQIRGALNRLSGADAEILILKYVHDWDYQTISENLGIELPKIAHRLRRARSRLRRELSLYFEPEYRNE